MSGLRPDVAVVGAGIVGAACAEALTAAGLSVEVVESRFEGSGATGSAMGHLVVLDDTEAQFALTAYSLRLWEELSAELPPEAEETREGTLWVAADGEEMARVGSRAAFYGAHGVRAEVLDDRALAEAEPKLRPGLPGGLRVPGDRVLYPPVAAAWLLRRAVDRGGRLRRGEEVLEVGDGFVRTSSGRGDAGQIIVAAGIETPRLLPGAPVSPKKGHLVITDRCPGFCRHQLVELGYLRSAHGAARESVAFNLQPRATGQLLVGSSREIVGLDPTVNRRLLARMVGRALEYVPALARLSAIRIWTGFRPATPDNLPLIGRWPGRKGVWVAAGHEGLGITTSLGTARLLTDLFVGRAPAIDPSPFDPARGAAHA